MCIFLYSGSCASYYVAKRVMVDKYLLMNYFIKKKKRVICLKCLLLYSNKDDY